MHQVACPNSGSLGSALADFEAGEPGSAEGAVEVASELEGRPFGFEYLVDFEPVADPAGERPGSGLPDLKPGSSHFAG